MRSVRSVRSVRSDSYGRIAIAKFPSSSHDACNVISWEKVALDLAHLAGIDVPPSRLLNLAGRHVLVVGRFDRTVTGTRIGYVSAMMSAMRPAFAAVTDAAGI